MFPPEKVVRFLKSGCSVMQLIAPRISWKLFWALPEDVQYAMITSLIPSPLRIITRFTHSFILQQIRHWMATSYYWLQV